MPLCTTTPHDACRKNHASAEMQPHAIMKIVRRAMLQESPNMVEYKEAAAVMNCLPLPHVSKVRAAKQSSWLLQAGFLS